MYVLQIRAGRSLARCHAVLGQNSLALAALEPALELARTGRYMLQEAFTVRSLAMAGAEAGGGAGAQWDQQTSKERLMEVAGRMDMDSALLLEQVLRID